MKKALVFYLWGKRNAGDMAICLGTISLLQDLGYEVNFVSRFSNEQADYLESKEYIEDYFNGIDVQPGVFLLDRDNSKPKMAWSYLKGITKLALPIDDRRLKQLISESDIVFLNGGNLLRGEKLVDYARLAALFYPFRIAKSLNKKIVCLPQSTAKSSKVGINMLNKRLGKFDKIFIRETNSFEVLKQEFPNIPFMKSTDACFFIKDVPKALERFQKKYPFINQSNKKSIALVLRSTTIGDIGEFSDSKKQAFTRSIINFIEKFKNQYDFYFVVQTRKDKEFTEYVKGKIEGNVKVDLIEEYDPYVIREVYRKMEFVLAMRLHAAILSMTAETPVLGYFEKEWGLKNPGIMNDVGMPWTTHGNDLVKCGEEIKANREEYVNRIRVFREEEKRKVVDAFNKDILIEV